MATAADKNGRVPDGFCHDSVRNSPQTDNVTATRQVPDGFRAENDHNPPLHNGLVSDVCKPKTVHSSPKPNATSSPAARTALFVLVAAAVVVLDQLSKVAARATLTPGEPVSFIPGVMDLSLVYNTGAAFSLGEGAGPFFVLIAAVICCVGLWVAWRRQDVPLSLLFTVACVAGGGIGNAIDRVTLGAVTDFFATTFIDFAVFNVADIFVTCGVFVALVLWWRWDVARERGEAGERA